MWVRQKYLYRVRHDSTAQIHFLNVGHVAPRRLSFYLFIFYSSAGCGIGLCYILHTTHTQVATESVRKYTGISHECIVGVKSSRLRPMAFMHTLQHYVNIIRLFTHEHRCTGRTSNIFGLENTGYAYIVRTRYETRSAKFIRTACIGYIKLSAVCGFVSKRHEYVYKYIM